MAFPSDAERCYFTLRSSLTSPDDNFHCCRQISGNSIRTYSLDRQAALVEQAIAPHAQHRTVDVRQPASPPGPTFSEKARERSPVPPAISSTRLPGRTPLVSIVKNFQMRCRPADIRSFITSYFCATEWKTSTTFCAFFSFLDGLESKMGG